MKCINLLAVLMLSTIAISCMIDPADKKVQEAKQQPQILQPAFVNPNTVSSGSGGASTAQQHYICPNGCSGSGGPAEGTCSVCGTAYVHNAAFHNQAGGTPTQTQAPAFQPPNVSVNDASATTAAAGGVYHYTCPNGCAGGGDAQGPCATCGAALAHNQAFHAQNATTAPQPVQSAGAPTPNAAGQYHYTCPNGCAGGGNSAGSCATCGGALAHNQAFHQ